MIDEQFGRWKLTGAEKEIAVIRGTSERSTRQQSLLIYQKSGLSGRAELAAFFLEDLLISTDALS